MQSNQENTNRRGSLAISALLNEKTTKSTSDDLSSDTISPVIIGGGRSTSKSKRKRISPTQYDRLVEIFDQTDTPSTEIRENLADELDMTKREVQVWFQNRRAKMNRTKTGSRQHRQSSLIPPLPNNNSVFYQVKPRIDSALPALENNNNHYPLYKQSPPLPHPCSVYPIAPMPNHYHPYHNPPPPPPPPPPSSQQYYCHQYYQQEQQQGRKPSAIDLLASAAEYVRTDRKEMTFSRT